MSNTFSPFPYQSLQDPNLHSGVVAVPSTGSLLVDLGIGHANFTPVVTLQGGTAAIANNAPAVTWAYGTKPGTFTIFTWKATDAGTTTLIAATVAVNVSFVAVAGSSVSQ